MFTISGGGGFSSWLWPDSSWSWLATSGTLFATLIGSLLLFLGKQHRRRLRHKSEFNPVTDRLSVETSENSGVYKCGLLRNDERELVETHYPEVTTLFQAFLRGMEVSENGRCLGERRGKNSDYTFIDYAAVFTKSHQLGSAFIKLGVKQGNSTHIGIYAKNCPEWFITTMASIRNSMVIVPLYDTLGAEAASYILQHTGANIVVVDSEEKAERILNFGKETPSLKHIVVIEVDPAKGLSSSLQTHARLSGISVHSFEGLIEGIEEEDLQEDLEPKPDDVYIICYTSGTTGTPKGVMLTHKNVVANISAFAFMLDKFMPDMLSAEQSILSYLPLSHMFEQTCHWCVIMLGGGVGYFSGDISDLSGDMRALRPTIFPVVPRLLNRFNDTMKSQVNKSGLIGKLMFNFAYTRKISELKNGIVRNDSIWDRLVFKKAQEQLGGCVRLIITGSAPISSEVLESCRVAFGAYICEGYGQTESTALASATWPGESIGGHCGGPAVCSLIKLEDVPDLNYFSKDHKGEILIKGPSVTKGYYKDAAKTAELFDDEGFLHTGDIGHILPNGALKIIDRKKHIFKLAQGEYVAPEKIENCYNQSSLVQQIYVDGDSLERFLIAIVVPMEKPLKRLYKELHGGAGDKSFEEICKDKEVVEHVLKDIQKIGKSSKLNSIEQVKAIYLETEPFSVENGLLTPTLKAKRPQIREKYSKIMKELYKNA